MNRITLTDAPQWFDESSAVQFTECLRWDGNNHVSKATGSQWDHEALYWTRDGNWVLHRWSQWQGRLETWTEVDEPQAVNWLISQETTDADLEELPEAVRHAVAAGFEAAEL